MSISIDLHIDLHFEVDASTPTLPNINIHLPGVRPEDESWNRPEAIPRALSYPSRPQEGVPNPHEGRTSSQGGTPLPTSGVTLKSYPGNAIHSSGFSTR